MSAAYQAKLAVPCCTVGIRVASGALSEIAFLPPSHRELAPRDPLSAEACRQIERYVRDPEFRFDLPLGKAGTLFQQRVWARISSIPLGQTRRYGDLAAELDSAPRAVGQACGANPFPLVVPCHRVVSAAGLGGFAHHEGGYLVSVKRWLLGHEGAA